MMRPTSCLKRLLTAARWGLAFACFAGSAGAESSINLPYPGPELFRATLASTYDLSGNRVGGARVEVSQLDNGHVSVRLESGFDGGAQIALEAELEPITVGETQMLRILRERSQSVDEAGTPLVILQIDHVAGEASCTNPGADPGKRSVLRLPSPDRVVNVPLNLLFRSLGFGTVSRIKTQVFFCLGGARTIGFHGTLAEDRFSPGADGRQIREVRYGPDGGSFLSWAAKAFAPKISFWMDTNHQGAYVAHRMPLYSQGPAVYVIADGVDPSRVIAR